jgi:hypothetical protein
MTEITITIKLESQEEFQVTMSTEASVKELKDKCVEKSKLDVTD